VSYFLAFWNEIINYLFDVSGGDIIAFGRQAIGGGAVIEGGDGQWLLTGNNLPDLTTKGSDMLAAIMTIAHNGLVALAQLSTLLPANALQ
jgi:hypothetical protein